MRLACSLRRRKPEARATYGFVQHDGEKLLAREEFPIIAIPIALKTFRRIVFSFQCQKFFELRIARQDLLWSGEFVIGQVITPATSYRQIDQATERASRSFDAA